MIRKLLIENINEVTRLLIWIMNVTKEGNLKDLNEYKELMNLLEKYVKEDKGSY